MTRLPYRRTRGAEAGFTLLEALVAIALLAGTMVAIFQLVATTLNSAHRVGASNETAEIELNATEAMTVVNPMLQDAGAIDLGPYRLRWTSTAVSPVSDGLGYPRGTGLFQLALYDCAVRVEAPDGALLTSFTLRRLGYRRVRDPQIPLTSGTLPGG
ncbi:MAG: prepilin-type N-terminal cleavage/methylation domain-containing protein [Alphaproteobacteria bacterium]|nr:prepilin-type N-terminal cleavage/methylation domain-containing protein [Alphaproteobacteria bacterium]